MKIMRSNAQPELIHMVLTDSDAQELREALRKEKSPLAKEVRKCLKKLLT